MSQLAADTTILNAFFERTSKSRALHTNAQQFLPGGNSRTVVYFNPYPIYLTRGKGCRIYDVDGNEYVDYLSNYTSIILGHGHPKITAAVQEQLEQGTCYASPTEFEARHAEILQQRVPSLELLRYANSGSEATLNAIRAARAFTGKPKLAKMEELIRRYLGKGPLKDGKLKQKVNANRAGIWVYSQSTKNLRNAEEIAWNKKDKTWFLTEN